MSRQDGSGVYKAEFCRVSRAHAPSPVTSWGLLPTPVDSGMDLARMTFVQVVLRKLGRGSRAVSGRLVRAPRKGSVVVIEFSDGMHEYVTTPVKRVLRLASRDVFYIETVNSRYRLEVRDRERALDDASSG